MMKKILVTTLVASLSAQTFAADLSSEDNKVSYTIGYTLGLQLKDASEQFGDTVKLNREVLFEAITDTLDSKSLQLDEKQMEEAMRALQTKVMAKAQAEQEKSLTANREEAKKLLAENQKKDGVTVTKSGLQYRVIKAGQGAKPTEKDVVKVHYKGSLADGTEFDSSARTGQPVEFPLNAVIQGWVEGLQLMPVGSTYEFVIPANLAYGEMAPPDIGPDRALIFEVELLDIVTPTAAPTKPAEKPAAKATETKPAEKAEKPAEKPAEKSKEKAEEKSATDTVKDAAKAAVTEKVDAVKDAAKAVVSEQADTLKDAAKDAVKKATDKAVEKITQ